MNTQRHKSRIVDSIAWRVLRLALAIACLCLPLTGYAATYYVGTCKPSKANFAAIQDAVNAVIALPQGSTIPTIYVCPGTYSEWVYITQPLNLQGIHSGNGAGATITAPGSLPPNVVDNVPAQVLVYNPGGPVNISGITIDGTGIPTTQSGASILYDSASGTIDHVVTQNLNGPLGYGIWILDDNSVSPAVTVKNSLVSFPATSGTALGIWADTGDITLNVTNTFLSVPGRGGYGILDYSTGTSTISNSTISTGYAGTESKNGTVSITGNTIIAPYGVLDYGPSTSTMITGNVLIDNEGIITRDTKVTIKGNQFLLGSSSPGSVGIQFDCSTPTAIGGNTFLGTTSALIDVPSGASLQGTAGTYFDVQTIESICQ